ncbi:hypothetical protein DRE_01542 [Drechslerella stenobrocha 248]|uniref:DUF924-domain-containing protein n=1 Tax=Drechslerella stenobrocha 248 TaxID=1043628 RepID=W7I4J2_9PEZI|nr:hypothetical protein DRE_01542 [Drechslerella stenobrocha 248]
MATIRSLNRAIFNPALYQSIRDLWFGSLPWGAKYANEEATQRWFLAPKDEKLKFDDLCRQKLGSAVLSLSPAQFPIAGLTETDVATPFIAEIDAADHGGEESAKTAVSLMILLDQIPRNLYRTNETLQLVYRHYDPIALSVAKRILAKTDGPTNRVDLHPSIRNSLACRMWILMPLMHSEDLADHVTHEAVVDEIKKENMDNEEMVKALEYLQHYEKLHADIIKKFGRFPHRNESLGRVSTEEEKKWLEEGGTRFGVGE